GGAVHVEIAAGGGESIAQLERVHDVVLATIFAARLSHRLAGCGSDGRLRISGASEEEGDQQGDFFHGGCLLSEEKLAGVRTVYAHVTTGTVAIARIGKIVIGRRTLHAVAEFRSEGSEESLAVMTLQA